MSTILSVDTCEVSTYRSPSLPNLTPPEQSALTGGIRLGRVDWQFTLALAAYDLIRLPKLMGAAA